MNVLVTSPMRVGSTWVHELLIALLKPQRCDFVRTPDEALAAISGEETCVLKSHQIIDLDLPALSRRVHAIRVLRNYKDCLISRALYCRNVRHARGQPISRPEQSAIDACAGTSDHDFANQFLNEFRDLGLWMGDLVKFERGEFNHTFYYEMLLHNMHDELWEWVETAGLTERLGQGDVAAALNACSFKRMKAQAEKGFVGSTGVGQWMQWLEPDLCARLDALYFDMREKFFQHPTLRHPLDRPAKPKVAAHDRVPLFVGGIGDIFVNSCTTDRYRILNDQDGPEVVVNVSPNEYANEIFKWHPKADRFKVVSAVKPQQEPWSRADFLESLGISGSRLYEGSGQQIDWLTQFYPPPRDLAILKGFEGRSFGLYAPFSKDTKTLREGISELLLPALRNWLPRDVELLGVGRNYKKVNKTAQDLSGYAGKGWLTDLSSLELSVPGSIELARRAQFYVGANSCLALVTMSLGRPTVILEPANHTNPPFWPRLFKLDECLLIQKFDAVDCEAIIAFLRAILVKAASTQLPVKLPARGVRA